MHHPRQDSTYHGLCYTSRGALGWTRNSSLGPLHEGSIRRPIAPWVNSYHRATSHSQSSMGPPHEWSIRRPIAPWANSYHGATSHSQSSMGPPHEGSIRRPIAPWANALTTELHLTPRAQWVLPMNDRSDDPSHHERTLLPRSYISLPALTKTGMLYCVNTYDIWLGVMLVVHVIPPVWRGTLKW